jgi:hypothetical protein
MAQVGLACVCGSRARSAAEGAELGWLPAWLGRFLFSFFLFLLCLFLLLLSFPVSCEVICALRNET